MTGRIAGPAAKRAPGPKTAGTTLPPSSDLKRTKKTRQPSVSAWLRNQDTEPRLTLEANHQDPRHEDPEVNGQSDDPQLIDDVV